MSISIKNLNYIYDPNSPFSSAAIKDVSIEIANGEFVCIIGHTGSGKSTLVQHLNGLLAPTSAEKLTVEGIDLLQKKPNKKLLRRQVGMVFQYPEYQLIEQTVYDDIAYGPKNLGIEADKLEKCVFEAMEQVGLSKEIVQASPFELSGGQKRRVAIAGVLAMKPKVLVLDEPIAGLDPLGKNEILQIIENYHKKNNATVIMISHNMDDIVRIADRVVVMHKGQKVLDGTPEQVFSNYEKIIEIGLELPTISQIVKNMRENGKDIPREICTLEAFIEYLKGDKR